MSALEKTTRQDAAMRNRLWWLIVVRVATAAILFLLSRTLFSSGPSISDHSVFLIFLTVTALSIIYALVLRFNERWQLQAGLQFFIDVLCVTWLIWVTGDVHSPFAALYIV